MRSRSRFSQALLLAGGLALGASSAIYAVEIPKPVINVPKPIIPRPVINVPRPAVTVNVPKPVINVPRPAVTVNVPKPVINVPRPAVTVNVPKPVVNVPKPAVTVNVPKPAVVVPKVDVPKPTVAVTVPKVEVPHPVVAAPKVDVPRPIVPQPVVSVPKPTAPSPVVNLVKPTVPPVQVTAPKPTVPTPAVTSPVVPEVQIAIPPKTVGPVNPPTAVVDTPKSVIEIIPPKIAGPVRPPTNLIIGNPTAPVTPDGTKVVSPVVPPATVIATPTNGAGAAPLKVGSPVTSPIAELPKQTGPAKTPGSTTPNGIANGPSVAPGAVATPVGGPNADPPKISNGGPKAVGEATVESPPGKRIGGPNADPPKISNGGPKAVGEAIGATPNSASSQMNLPNGTFGKATQNPDGTVTVSNNLGTVTLTKQQMNQVAAGDVSALKPLMGNGAAGQAQAVPIISSNGNVTQVQLPNGTFGKVVMNPDGTITLSNNLGTVTLTKQQMSRVSAGDMSALKPLMANGANGQTQTQAPLINSNGNQTEIRLPNGTFGKVTMNPDGTITLSNNLGTVTLTKQQMNKVAAGDMSALKSLTAGNNQNSNAQSSNQMRTASVQPSQGSASPQQGQGGNNGHTYGSPPSSICPIQQCSSTVDEGPNGVGGKPFYEVNFKYSGDTPPPPPPGMHYMDSNMTGCGGGSCTMFLQFNTQTASASTPAIQTPSVSAGGRQPIYSQDANGVWHKSYWFAPPADILENYGPLSDASRQPVLPFGFFHPDGPPPGAIFADDSNPNAPDPKLQRPTRGDGNDDDTQQAADNARGANDDNPKGNNQQQTADASPNQQQDTDGSDKGKPFTPGSWDDPNCAGGCYDAKFLNDIGIQPQFPDGTLAPPPTPVSAGNDMTTEELQAAVAKNTQLIGQQMAAAPPTDPQQSSPIFGGMINVGGCGTGNMECGGRTFTYDSSGIHQYATDPKNSTGTPGAGITGYIAVFPQDVANGDSGTYTAPGGFSVMVAPGKGWLPAGVAVGWGVGTEIPSVSYTRGKPVGYSPWPGSTTRAPNSGSGHLFNDSQGNLWWQGANGQTRMVERVSP